MNIIVIILGCIMFGVVFTCLGYMEGINSYKKFIKSVINGVVENREKTIRELEPEVNDFITNYNDERNAGKISSEKIDEMLEKAQQLRDERHEAFILKVFGETVLK